MIELSEVIQNILKQGRIELSKKVMHSVINAMVKFDKEKNEYMLHTQSSVIQLESRMGN